MYFYTYVYLCVHIIIVGALLIVGMANMPSSTKIDPDRYNSYTGILEYSDAEIHCDISTESQEEQSQEVDIIPSSTYT
jgi:hypothetical protein